LAKTLTAQEKTIVAEFAAVQGKPVDIGGYYFPSQEKLQSIMCPSKTFNEALKTV
jgi:isocitrate dehydrogenase